MLGNNGRSLELVLGAATKSFRFAGDLGTPWFDQTLEHAAALRARNAWQRFPNPTTHVDRRGLYLADQA